MFKNNKSLFFSEFISENRVNAWFGEKGSCGPRLHMGLMHIPAKCCGGFLDVDFAQDMGVHCPCKEH